MKLHLYAFTLLLGVVLAVHLSMNGKVGAALGNPRVGNALFWAIGAVGAAVIGAIVMVGGVVLATRND
jgi:transporter family-2 protein